jgi:hypothetical protein
MKPRGASPGCIKPQSLAAIFTLSAKFKIENILVITDKAYLLCHQINRDVHFFLTEKSYLNDSPIEKWLDIPRSFDSQGDFRDNYFAFALKSLHDKDRFKVGEIVVLTDEEVKVLESFKLSDGRIIAFLKCCSGKFENIVDIVLSDSLTSKRWKVRQYLFTYGSVEGYEKIQKQETENVFQYLLLGIDHQDKPEVGASLQVLKNGS